MDGLSETAPVGYMRDAKGALVPMTKIKPQHLLEDDLCQRLVAGANGLRNTLHVWRETAFGEVDSLLDMLRQDYGAARGGTKGNVQFTSFDGRLRVDVAMQDSIAFGAELTAAKALIDQCLTRWSDGANDNLKVVVNDAFSVDKAGRLAVERILGLRRLAIEDADWRRAMDAIGDAVRVVSSKRYIRFYQRATTDAPWEAIPLTLSAA
jgi:hypothetical protein